MIFPLFRRRYDRAVVCRTNEVPMKRSIVAAGGGGQPKGTRIRRWVVVALVATAVAVALVVPSAGAKPKPVKPGQYVSVTCATGEVASRGSVAWLDKDGKVISTSFGMVDGSSVRFGPAPARAKSYDYVEQPCAPAATTTTVAPTTTTLDPNMHLTGSFTYPTDGEPRIIYAVNNSDARIFGVPSCPEATTTLDYAASTIDVPDDVELINQLGSTGSIMVGLPYIERDPIFGDLDERTVTYDFVCVPT
jgi:hypothetical protein